MIETSNVAFVLPFIYIKNSAEDKRHFFVKGIFISLSLYIYIPNNMLYI